MDDVISKIRAATGYFVATVVIAVLSQSRPAVSQEFNLRKFREQNALRAQRAAPQPGGMLPSQETEQETTLSLPAYSQAKSLRQDSTLRSVKFVDANIGVAVGDRGAILRSTDGGESWQGVPSPTEATLTDLAWTNRQEVIAVGGRCESITQISRGVVLRSRDSGLTWRVISDEDLPRLTKVERLDDGAILARGDWSHLMLNDHFISVDRGRRWNGAANERVRPRDRSSVKLLKHWMSNRSSPPLQSVCEIPMPADAVSLDDLRPGQPARLCSVHDHGTICTSDDGGKSWNVRRAQSRRDAILFIANRAEDVPWALVGNETLQWRNRVSILLVGEHSTAPESRGRVMDVAAMLGAGNVDWLDATEQPVGQESLSKELKRWLVLHRAPVVVIDQSVATSTAKAIEKLAPTVGSVRVMRSEHRFDDDAKWQRSASQRSASQRSSSIRSAILHARAMLPQIGMLASDLAQDALHVIHPNHPACDPNSVPSIALTRIYDVSGSGRGGGGESLVSGLPENRATRLSAPPIRISRHRMQVTQARTKQTLRLLETIARSDSRQNPEILIRQLLDQTASEDRRRLTWSLMQVASRQVARDQGELESVMLRLISDRYPDEAIGAWANLRSESITNSVERKESLDTLADPQQRPNWQADFNPSGNPTVAVSPFQNPASQSSASPYLESPYLESPHLKSPYSDSPSKPFPINPVQQASAISPIVNPQPVGPVGDPSFASSEDRSPTGKPTLVDLQFDLHPSSLIAKDAIAKSQLAEYPNSVELTRLAKEGQRPWRSLLNRFGPDTLIALSIAKPPKLDGISRDSIWKEMKLGASEKPQIQIAQDENFVFFLIKCRAESLMRDSSTARSRDQDLDTVDRLQLSIDVDRDLMSAYRLEVTDAGRTRDSVDGRTAWQPNWYVGIHPDESVVAFEIAVKKEDLNILPMDHPEWFVSARVIEAGENQGSDGIFADPNQWTRVVFR